MSGNNDKVREQGNCEEMPVCLECMEPVDKLSYYCPKCGAASGQLTPYLPFVNIRYNYSIFGRLWHKMWYEKTGVWLKIFSFFMIVFFVPFMLLGLPFVGKIAAKEEEEKSQTP